VLNSYGLTETSDGTTTIRPYDAMGKPAHCIGKPLPFVEMKIVDSEGREVGPGEEGQIAHRGPTVVEAYWRRPEETAKAFRDGWFHTGDIAKRDEEGFVYFLGRKDDMIVTGGENVYPAEVEEAILRNPKVADAAVLGVPDVKWGQTIKAVISVKDRGVGIPAAHRARVVEKFYRVPPRRSAAPHTDVATQITSAGGGGAARWGCPRPAGRSREAS